MDEYANGIFRFMLKSVKDESTANDLVQDTFLKLWEHRKNVNPEKVKSWLFTTAYHLMINYVKKNSRNDFSKEIPEFGSEDARRYEWKEIVEICLEMLTPDQKSVLLLRDYEGYSYKEIGKILTMTEPQVKSLLFRARTKIKESVKNYDQLIVGL